MTDSVYQSLLANRIIFLGSEVRDENANAICAQMLLLNAEDANKDIYLYINSPGGSVDSGMAIFDTMQWISNDVATVAMGMAASMGQFLLSAGTKGKRYALPHAKILMHQPLGQGHVIAFAEDANYRAYTEATMLLFMNAVLLGPAF